MPRGRTPQEAQDEFSDIMSSLSTGSTVKNDPEPETPEDEENTEGPDESTEGDEPRDEPDNQTDSSDEPEDDEEQDVESEDEDQPEGESDDEDDSEGDDVDEEAPVYELPSGEKVTGEELVEKYSQFQSAFTKKRQEDSEAVKTAQQRAQDTRDLAREIVASEPMRELVNEFPDRLEMLLDNPEDTRYLLQNPSQVEKLRSEWEILRENPDLAEKVARRDSESDDDEEVDSELALANARREAQALVDDFRGAVATVAKEYEGVEPDAVARDMLRMVNITPETQANEAVVLDGLNRLYNWLYVRDPQSGQLFINGNTIRDRFEVLQARESDASDEEDDTEEHNKKVDEQLAREGKDRPPAVSSDDSPGSPQGDEVTEMKDFGDAMKRFMPGA